jgi:hypothetical protein
MKYILDQAEFDALKSEQKRKRQISDKKLQDLCTKIANEMPVKFWGREEATPWGCKITDTDEWYCDECPVQEICPHEQKSYSQ